MTLDDRAASVRSQADLSAFLMALKSDLAVHSDEWQNLDLPSFLEAMSAWLHDMDMEKYLHSVGQELSELPPWRIVAEILMAARVYE